MDYKQLKAGQKAGKHKIQNISKALGMHRERVGQILNGQIDPRVSELEAIARHLGYVVALVPAMTSGAAIGLVSYTPEQIREVLEILSQSGEIRYKKAE